MDNGNFVAKLAQRFFDVRTADDKDLVFSSEFPLLKEEVSQILVSSQLGTSSSYLPIYTHSLGYHPFFLVYDENGEQLQSTDWAVDNDHFYALNQVSQPLSGRYRWIIYQLPLYESFQSSVSGGTAIPRTAEIDHVLKVALPGKDVNSDDLRDFTIHSRARSPLVHIVSPKKWEDGDEAHIVEHGLNYNPIVFGFAKTASQGTKSTYVNNSGQSVPYLDRRPDALQIVSNKSSTIETSIIVFKDPFLAPVVKEVKY